MKSKHRAKVMTVFCCSMLACTGAAQAQVLGGPVGGSLGGSLGVSTGFGTFGGTGQIGGSGLSRPGIDASSMRSRAQQRVADAKGEVGSTATSVADAARDRAGQVRTATRDTGDAVAAATPAPASAGGAMAASSTSQPPSVAGAVNGSVYATGASSHSTTSAPIAPETKPVTSPEESEPATTESKAGEPRKGSEKKR